MSSLITITDIIINHLVNPAPKQDLLFKYIPLLSPIIVIITFLFNNWYTARTKKAESKRAWYFKAYFEPNLKKIEDFFLNADSIMKIAIEKYSKEVYENPDDKTIFISSVLFDLANSKRKFEIEVLMILQITYPTIFNSFENALMNFEDAGTNAFEEGVADPYFGYISALSQIKGGLIKELSIPALA